MTGKPHINDPRRYWRVIQNNWIIQVVNKGVAACLIIGILVIAIRWSSLPPKIPLWYSRPWGLDQLASPIGLFILPLGGLVVYLVNLIISVYLTAEYLIFTQVLFLSSFLINILSLITLIKIVFLVS
jgi:hypothetical protein